MKRKKPSSDQTVTRIKADPAKQKPNNSYSPKLYYEDVTFSCRDCGVESVWTGKQQRLWYEEWGGPVQSTAIRCRACRQRIRREKIEQKKHMEEMAKTVKQNGQR
jgi:peptide subunit release factor 1 (eRF1)